MDYPWLRDVHLGSVVLSISLFVFRGGLMLIDSPVLHGRVLRILPHAIDVVLLASAIGLCIHIRQYPGTSAWLTAKVLGLVAYVILGSLALRRGRTRRIRLAALAGSLVAVSYVIGVARHHHPLAWLA